MAWRQPRKSSPCPRRRRHQLRAGVSEGDGEEPSGGGLLTHCAAEAPTMLATGGDGYATQRRADATAAIATTRRGTHAAVSRRPARRTSSASSTARRPSTLRPVRCAASGAMAHGRGRARRGGAPLHGRNSKACGLSDHGYGPHITHTTPSPTIPPQSASVLRCSDAKVRVRTQGSSESRAQWI